MASLTITIIDVGWGDSILIESQSASNETHFALVDCNDTKFAQSSTLFVKRHMERRRIDLNTKRPLFDFVLLTHDHSDHANGIKAMMDKFGTDNFWYSKSVEYGGFAHLLKYANRSANVKQHQSIDNTKILPNLGDVKLKVLWPPYTSNGPWDSNNENNNSVVLVMTLDQVSFMLCGDCEASNWPPITANLPPGLAVFQVPHHGAQNGLFDGAQTPWLSALQPQTKLAVSCHTRPHQHPAQQVIQHFQNLGITPFRTDLHYHLTFTTDGTLEANGDPNLRVFWTH